MSGRLKITQVRSSIGRPGKHGRTLRALGLRKMNQTVVHRDTPQIRGMVFQVEHLLRVERLGAEEEE
jgi:large subunit ribosomal protein L30